MFHKAIILPALIAAGLGTSSLAWASSITVNSADNIYGAGQSSAPGGGNVPGFITLSLTATSITFNSVTGSTACGSAEGCITLNGGTLNDPDGQMAATGSSSSTGWGSIAGIANAPGGGYLVGVFVAAGGPSGGAPAALDFTSSGLGTSFSSLSPLLDQTFFIGDGLTGDGTGQAQVFNVPTGAVDLYLGISDAPGYNGSPGAFGDNFGTFTVDYSVAGSSNPTGAATPEPASVIMLSMGLLGFGAFRYRRRSA
jgi:hypothetical protein